MVGIEVQSDEFGYDLRLTYNERRSDSNSSNYLYQLKGTVHGESVSQGEFWTDDFVDLAVYKGLEDLPDSLADQVMDFLEDIE